MMFGYVGGQHLIDGFQVPSRGIRIHAENLQDRPGAVRAAPRGAQTVQQLHRFGTQESPKTRSRVGFACHLCLFCRSLTDTHGVFIYDCRRSIINHFLEVYNRLCPRVKQIVISMDRDALKHVESLSAHHALQPLLDELELAKDEFNSVFEDSWHTLMNIEMQLFERTEEGNSNFENTIKEMTNEFIEQAQAQFVLLREAETSFSEALIGVVQQFVTFKAASGHAHEIPRALQEVQTRTIQKHFLPVDSNHSATFFNRPWKTRT